MKKPKTNTMRLMRVVCVVILAVVAVSLFGLAACDSNEPTLTHTHKMTAVAKKDATCTEKGHEAYWTCDECGKMFSDSEGKSEINSVPEIAAKGHSVPSMTETKPADCTNKGQKSGKCDVCQQTVTEDIPALGHNVVWTSVDEQTHVKKCTRCDYTEGTPQPHNFEGDECTDCGAKKAGKPYTLSEDGSTLTFGSYPQSKVEDTALQSMLNAAIQNKTPTTDEFNGWTDYKYLDNKVAKSYMWFVDVEYQNDMYRGVYFTKYRPYSSTTSCSASNTRQLDNGYEINTVYWFKFEPITWRILTQQDGKVLIMSDLIIDSQNFYLNTYERTDNGTIYANNYKESDIRTWLNENFYNTAFDELCKEYVVQTEVDNSANTTSNENNPYTCANTFDNVFLLSFADLNNENYNKGDLALTLSAYAISQGAWKNFYGCGVWWQRSPSGEETPNANYFVDTVNAMGGVTDTRSVTSTDAGVVPALWLTL